VRLKDLPIKPRRPQKPKVIQEESNMSSNAGPLMGAKDDDSSDGED
jgi:hypothetical protein